MDIMAARHYADTIAGLGASGYWGGAAWRVNTVYTCLDEGAHFLLISRVDRFSVPANFSLGLIAGTRDVEGTPVHEEKILDGHLVLRQRSGFVENDGVDLSEALERSGVTFEGPVETVASPELGYRLRLRFRGTALLVLSDPVRSGWN